MKFRSDRVYVHGASDDLIVVEGALEGEYSLPPEDFAVLAFSDGTLIGVEYTDGGNWRIQLRNIGAAFEEHQPTEVVDSDRVPDYTDVLEFNQPLDWVCLVENVIRAKEGRA